MLLVVKMRGSEHSIDMTEYSITGKGVIVGAPLRGYQGLTSGIPGAMGFCIRREYSGTATRECPDSPAEIERRAS
jgi:circadian clock protein KaiC